MKDVIIRIKIFFPEKKDFVSKTKRGKKFVSNEVNCWDGMDGCFFLICSLVKYVVGFDPGTLSTVVPAEQRCHANGAGK